MKKIFVLILMLTFSKYSYAQYEHLNWSKTDAIPYTLYIDQDVERFIRGGKHNNAEKYEDISLTVGDNALINIVLESGRSTHPPHATHHYQLKILYDYSEHKGLPILIPDSLYQFSAPEFLTYDENGLSPGSIYTTGVDHSVFHIDKFFYRKHNHPVSFSRNQHPLSSEWIRETNTRSLSGQKSFHVHPFSSAESPYPSAMCLDEILRQVLYRDKRRTRNNTYN